MSKNKLVGFALVVVGLVGTLCLALHMLAQLKLQVGA